MRFFILFYLFSFLLNAESSQALDFENRKVTYYLNSEPPTLETMDEASSTSVMITGHTFEGLMRYDANNQLTYGVAKSHQVSSDGRTYTFQLRKNAKWSDGIGVKAQDFEFAWKECINPKKASKYAFIMFFLKNAEKANGSKIDLDAVGVKALDDYTLEVTLEQPCGFFLSLTTFLTYMPCRESFYQKFPGKYAAEAENCLYNGPFKMVEWEHESSILLKKNEHYWNKKEIWLETIDYNYVLKDPKAMINLFEAGKICMASLDKDTVKSAMRQQFNIRKFSDGGLSYIQFNCRKGRYSHNKNFRKAIQYSFNTYEYVYSVVGLPGNTPGASVFPAWLPGEQKPFRKEYPMKTLKPDVARAKAYLEKARLELGVEKFDKISYLIGDSPSAKLYAEYIQQSLKKTLDLDIKIDVQTFKQRLAKAHKGDFDLGGTGWGPDYNDPMTFGDLFASWNENNRGAYHSADYDKNVRIAQNSTDQKVRMAAFNRCQKIMEEDAGILPLFETGVIYVQNPRLTGVIRNVVGADSSFVYAKIIEEKK